MGFLLIIAVAFVAAENIVELEPVRAITCSKYNTTVPSDGSPATIDHCLDTPYCFELAGSSGRVCYNDPCLKYVDDAATTDASCGSAVDVISGSGSHDCELVTYTQHCVDGTPTARKYCRYKNVPAYGVMTDCIYNNLKNSSICDPWSCTPDSGATGGSFCGDGTPRNRNTCTHLPTEAYCKLNPHCYWGGSSTKCIEDTCTQFGSDCDTHNNTNNSEKKCVSFNIFDGAAADSTKTKILCVDPDKNAAPNKCYDLAENSAANHPGSAGVCATYTLPKCSANEECKAELGTSGPYADYYCGDVTHTSLSFAIHAPAVITIVLAVLAFLW